MKTSLATVVFALLLFVVPFTAPAQNTENLYLDKCANCHGKDGAGQTIKGKKLKLKDLKSADAQKMTDVQMIELLNKGKGDMQSYSKELNAQQIKDLVAYVRGMAKK